MPTSHAGVGSAARIYLAKRAAILTLNWKANWTFERIAADLGVHESTASQIIQSAKNRAADLSDFEDILACLEDVHRGGREQRFPEGSAQSEALRACSQQDEEHWQMPFPDIAKELGIVAARSTIESVFHLQYQIFQ